MKPTIADLALSKPSTVKSPAHSYYDVVIKGKELAFCIVCNTFAHATKAFICEVKPCL